MLYLLTMDRTGSDLAPMLFLAACLAFAGVMVVLVQSLLTRRAQAAAVHG